MRQCKNDALHCRSLNRFPFLKSHFSQQNSADVMLTPEMERGQLGRLTIHRSLRAETLVDEDHPWTTADKHACGLVSEDEVNNRRNALHAARRHAGREGELLAEKQTVYYKTSAQMHVKVSLATRASSRPYHRTRQKVVSPKRCIS